MWVVKKADGTGGLLCRTEQSLNIAKEHYESLGYKYIVEETNKVQINDPMEQ